jgi:hypothetical protein
MGSSRAPPLMRRRFFGTAALAAAGALAGSIAAGAYARHREQRERLAVLGGHLFADPTLDFTAQVALGATYYGAGNPGQLFAILSRIRDGDFESAYQAYLLAGREARQWADESLRKRHLISARAAFLWAANYLYSSLYFLDGTADPSRLSPTWREYAQCWAHGASLSTPGVERVEIPYEDTTLTGWFFRVDESRRRRPLVILNNGADGSELDMYVLGAAGGLARGYNCLTFNGPGQGDALWVKRLFFRPDWERVITPVVNYATAHPEVDSDRLALIGISQGGYFVSRALAFEHRIRAGVADPGVWDIGEVGTRQLPGPLRALLAAGEKTSFDRDVAMLLKLQPRARSLLAFRMRPYGLNSYYDLLQAVQKYQLADVAEKIRCPMLVINPQSEQFFVGQPQRLYDALKCPKTLLNFTRKEGADLHCEVNAPGYRDLRVYDWLDENMG